MGAALQNQLIRHLISRRCCRNTEVMRAKRDGFMPGWHAGNKDGSSVENGSSRTGLASPYQTALIHVHAANRAVRVGLVERETGILQPLKGGFLGEQALDVSGWLGQVEEQNRQENLQE
ncbi:hypothetical protein HUJ04_001068 [Dendroctonus ponderosae]|nr:hypothetical protein HUJ04_001068 [Dendroctonus ponderosae]